jgi:hypothetical protein
MDMALEGVLTVERGFLIAGRSLNPCRRDVGSGHVGFVGSASARCRLIA